MYNPQSFALAIDITLTIYCNVTQSSIFSYPYANMNYILTACKAYMSIHIVWICGAVLSHLSSLSSWSL